MLNDIFEDIHTSMTYMSDKGMTQTPKSPGAAKLFSDPNFDPNITPNNNPLRGSFDSFERWGLGRLAPALLNCVGCFLFMLARKTFPGLPGQLFQKAFMALAGLGRETFARPAF